MTRQELPHHEGSERALVGTMLVYGQKVVEAAASIGFTSAMLYDPTLAAIWTAAVTLVAEGMAVTHITVGAALTRAYETGKKLQARGGEAFLGELMGDGLAAESAVYHARVVAERWQARCRIEGYQAAIAKLYEGEGTAEVQASVEQLHVETGIRGKRRRGPRTLFDMRKDAAKRLERIADQTNPAPRGITTGLPDLDLRLGGGLHGGEYTIIAGRPGDGKSALGYGIALAAPMTNSRGLFISIEMPESSIATRDLAHAMGMDQEDVRMVRFDQTCWLKLHRAQEQAQNVPVWVETEVATLDDVLSTMRVWRADPSAGGAVEEAVVVVDYIQIVRVLQQRNKGRWQRFKSPEEQISEASAAFREFAKETNTAVAALSQLNREIMGRTPPKPILSDLRGSGSLEQDAHNVLFVYRPGLHDPANYAEWEAEVIIGKQRNGPTVPVPVMWHGPTTRFLPLPMDPPSPPQQQALPGTDQSPVNGQKRPGRGRKYSTPAQPYRHPNAPEED